MSHLFKDDHGNLFLVSVYDNGGESFDRYTVVIAPQATPEEKEFYGMSEKPLSPTGFNQYLGSYRDGYKEHSELGIKLHSDDIPEAIMLAIKDRLTNEVSGGC